MTPDQAADLAVDIAQHRGWGKNATPIDAWTKFLLDLDENLAIRTFNTLGANQTEAPTIAEFRTIYTRLNQPTVPHQTCPTCAGTGRIFPPPTEPYDRAIPEELRKVGLEQLSLIKEHWPRGA
jgi:hypothetical protein